MGGPDSGSPRAASARDQQLERRRPRRHVLSRELAQHAFHVLARARGIAVFQAQLLDPEIGKSVMLGLGEQLARLGRATLAAAQDGEPHHGLRSPERGASR